MQAAIYRLKLTEIPLAQLLRATNRLGEYAVRRPVTHQEVFATLYTCLGINLGQVRVVDPTGRPQYLVDGGGEPLRELV